MAGKGITIVIQGDGESAERALKMVQEQMHQTAEIAERESSKIVESMESVKAALESVGVYIGLREAIDLMKEMVGSSVELGMEIGHMAKETGISAQNLSVLKYASDSTGVSFEALSKGSLKLSKDMLDAEEGKKTAINSFTRLGISQDEVHAKSSDLYGMLGLIADKFESIPDGPQKAAAAIGIFGKAGAALIPFLDQGAAGIEELRGQAESLGLVLDEAGVAKMEALHEESVRLKGALEGVGLQMTSGLTPALLQVGASFLSATDKGHEFEAMGEGLGVGLKGLVTVWDLLTVAIHQTMDVLAGAGYALYDTAELAGNAAKLLAQVANNPGNAVEYWDAAKAKLKGNLEEMRSDTKSNQDLLAADGKKFHDQMAALWGDAPTPKPGRAAGGAGGSVTPGDQSGKDKSTDGIARAATALAEAEAQAGADAIRNANTRMLAELDAGHKAQILSDATFYREKLLLEKDSLDAEADAIATKQKDLQALLEKQHGNKLLKRDANGDSAEELKTQTELVQLADKLNALAEKRAALDSGYQVGVQVRGEEVKLATLKMAAEVEAETNRAITARLALLREESDQTLKKVGNTAGKDSPEYAEAQQLEQLKEAKLQIGDVNRQIIETENDYKRAVEDLNDAATKDPRLKIAAQQQINRVNQEEAEQLRGLVAQYHALADVLGGEFTEKAKALDAELEKLSTPDKREDAQFGKLFADGVESMARRVADDTLKAKTSFHDMAKGIEQDLLNLALKMAEEKWLTPLLAGAFGGGGGLPNVGLGAASLGAPAAASGGGGVGGFFGKALGALGLGGGGGAAGGGAPSVVINLTNTTSAPVSAVASGQSWDAEAKQFVVHAVLEDASSGGPLAALFGGAL